MRITRYGGDGVPRNGKRYCFLLASAPHDIYALVAPKMCRVGVSQTGVFPFSMRMYDALIG